MFVYDNPLELEKFIPYKDEVKLLLRVSFPNPETKVDLSKSSAALRSRRCRCCNWPTPRGSR